MFIALLIPPSRLLDLLAEFLVVDLVQKERPQVRGAVVPLYSIRNDLLARTNIGGRITLFESVAGSSPP